MPDDFPYKLGLLPGQIPVGLCELPFYVAGALPKAPPLVKVPAFDWGMLGNDEWGDCAVAGLEHLFECDSLIASAPSRSWPDAQHAVDYYLSFTGGQDRGAVLSQVLEYVRQHGYYGHTIRAYAPIGVHDVPTLQLAIFMYGGAYSGIRVTRAMQQASLANQPWTTELLASPIVGGHCIPIVGYDDLYVYAVTWGLVQPITYSMLHAILTESWAAITGEFVARNGDGRGVSLSALEADLPRLVEAA